MFKIFTALSENRTLEKQVQSLKTEKQQLNDTLKALNKELTQTRETLGKTQIRHAREMQKYVAVEERMQKAKQAYKALRTQEQKSIVEIQGYKARIVSLEAELATLKQQSQAQGTENEPSTQTADKKDEKIQTLEHELTETQEKYLNVSTENQKLREDMQQIKEQTRQYDKAQRAPEDTKVLIVDDSITTRTLMKKILESAAYEVHLAKDGREGKALLETTAIDIVVTDAEMPNMDGFELTHWIKNESKNPETPVIMIVSMANQDVQAKAEKAGVSSFITKNNFHQQVFLSAIEKALHDSHD